MRLKLGWSCITLMQNSLASFAKILVVFACLEKPQQFSSIFIARCRKNWQCLANFAKKTAMILARENRSPRNFCTKKPRRQALGIEAVYVFCLDLFHARQRKKVLYWFSWQKLAKMTYLIDSILCHKEDAVSKIFFSNQFLFLPHVCQVSSRKRANVGWSCVLEFFNQPIANLP